MASYKREARAMNGRAQKPGRITRTPATVPSPLGRMVAIGRQVQSGALARKARRFRG